ncbi:o-succinylbenzoate synthase [Leptodesmis sp.]|uniref:o-succinylbenzoate synthase n=1 Tax=Leptodesmis sp. TaxID=3100501 RepID=UPI0040535B86
MRIRFAYRSYRRRFRQPLITRYGVWRERESIIIQLTDVHGRVGWGEIAPVPWFGSETLEEALTFCSQLPALLDFDQIRAIPNHLPACQFGFESAWEEIWYEAGGAGHEARARESAEKQLGYTSTMTNSVLLPAGKTALADWQKFWQQGARTFKWKIGVADLEAELALFQELMAQLPRNAQLRLDANGGLSIAQAERWLQVCESLPVEYLEQPLPPDQFNDLLTLSAQYSTPLALDEAVATLEQLKTCYQQGWQGIYVIKPAIAGFPSHLRQFCQSHAIDAVFSSVFETAIGQQAGLKLAAELGNCDRAMGYGIAHWFNESHENPSDLFTTTD